MSDSLYKLMVSISLKDATKSGFSDIQRNVENTAKKTKELQASLESFGKGIGKIFSSKGAQEEINNLSRKQLELRKQIATTTNSEQKRQLENELKAIGLVKQEISVRKSELSLQERINSQRLSDINQAKRIEKADNAEIARMKRQDEAEARRAEEKAQREKLANLRQLEAERQRYRVQIANQRAAAIEDRLNGILAARSAAYEAQQARRAEIGSSLSLGAGLAAGAASGAMLGGLKEGIASNSDMATSLTTIQIATAATKKQLSEFQDLAYRISNNTGQSAKDALQNISILASSGINDPGQLKALAAPIANFADVQFFKSGGKVSFEESAKQGVQLAHLFGAYYDDKNPKHKQIEPLLEQLTKISFAMPDNLSRFLTQSTYYVPLFRGAGVSDNDTLEAGAIMDRIGMGRGKGGSSLGNIVLNQMQALAQTGHVQKGRMAGLKMLGLANADGTSKFYKWSAKDQRNEFDIIGALKQIDKSVKQLPEGLTGKDATAWQLKRYSAINAALGITGERAALAITPDAINGIEDSLGRIARSGSLKQVQEKYQMTPSGQYQRVTSNFNNVTSALTAPWMDDLTHGLHKIGDEEDRLSSYLRKYPDVAKAAAAGLAGVSAALAVYSGAQLWGIASGLKAFATGIKAVAAAEATSGIASAAGGGGIAFGLGGEVLGGGGAGFAAARSAGLVAGLTGAAAGIAAFSAIPAAQNYGSTLRAPTHNENLVANVAQEWARLGMGRPDSIEPDGNGVIIVKGDIHIHVPAGTTQQQLDAITKAMKQHTQSSLRHPQSAPPGVHRLSLGR